MAIEIRASQTTDQQRGGTSPSFDQIYPVGSIYLSATFSTAAQVEAAFGGTWQAWGAGRVPVGVDATQTEFDTVGKTGGEKTHTLTIAEMPSHNHTFRGVNDGAATEESLGSYPARIYQDTKPNWTGYFIDNTGGGGAHNNLQPYITCYMYRRLA